MSPFWLKVFTGKLSKTLAENTGSQMFLFLCF